MGDIRQDLVAQYGNHGCAALIIQFRLRSVQCSYISNQDSTESVADGDLMCKCQDGPLEQRPKHSVQKDGIQDETRQLMQYDDPRNVFADIGVLIPSRIPEMAVCVSISGSSEQLHCRPGLQSASRPYFSPAFGHLAFCQSRFFRRSITTTYNVITGLQDSTEMSV
jgi:hypothetical protein